MSRLGLFSALASVALLSACASNGGAAKSMAEHSYKLPKNEAGFVYGAAAVFIDKSVVSTMCEVTSNLDSRCANHQEYDGVQIYSAFGFNAGGATTLALLRKDSPMHAQISYFDGRLGNSKQPFVKVATGKGVYGEILEVVSINGEGICKWSGLPRAGGTVCPSVGWDYRKDLNEWSNPRGILSVD